MATEIFVRKVFGSLVPSDQANADALEDLKNGEFKAVLSYPRNSEFHKKAFALLRVAYNAMEMPSIEHKGQKVQKNFERFRDDMTILSGHYDVVFNYLGEMRLHPRSWSFSSMSAEEFEDLYSKLIDVILQKVLSGYTADDLEKQVNIILSFV